MASDHVIAIVAISNRILHSSFRLLPPCTRTISWPFYRNRTNIGQIIIEYSNYFLVSQPFETFQSVLIFLCNIWKWPSITLFGHFWPVLTIIFHSISISAALLKTAVFWGSSLPAKYYLQSRSEFCLFKPSILKSIKLTSKIFSISYESAGLSRHGIHSMDVPVLVEHVTQQAFLIMTPKYGNRPKQWNWTHKVRSVCRS